MEEIILNQTKWNEKQKDFYGTLIYNITDAKANPIADIIIERTKDIISVDWFIPNRKGDCIKVVYDKNTDSIVLDKSDKEIKTNDDFLLFLTNISNIIKNKNIPDFFPKEKVNNDIGFKV